jgi:hypothetical protein
MTRLILAVAVAVTVSASACSNLPDFTANVCGNGVVDPGEDCDGDASAVGGTCGTTGPNACHFVCANSAACPTGYVCSADQRCRAPSSTFTQANGPYPFDADDVGVGDVDGDGTSDLIGVSSDTLSARFGNAAGDLSASTSQPISTPVTHAVFGDLDGDGHMDVMVPNSVGVFSFLASGQGFNPYPYTSLSIGDQMSAVKAADVEVVPDAFSEILAMVGKDMAYINTKPQYTVCIDGGNPPDCLLSTHDVSELLPGPLPTGRTGYEFGAIVPVDQDFTDEFLIAFKNADHVDLWSSTLPVIDASGNVDETTLSVVKIQSLQLPKAGTLGTQVRVAQDGTAAFGNFDLDGCTDLMIPVSQVDATGKFEALAIAYGSKVGSVCTGKLDPPIVVAEAALDPDGSTKGLIPRVIVDLDGDGISDVVTNELVTVTSCTRDQTGCKNGVNNAFALDFRGFTPRTWTAALATDINRDHIPDLAGIVAGQDDVDVMVGAGAGLLNRFQIATSLPPRYVRTGDFDGDLFGDVAVVTGDSTDPTTEDDDLVVLYGAASGGPSAPVDMGNFGVVEDLAPISLFTDIQHIDAITDMLVIADRSGRRGVAPLIGSATRRLLAPYLLSEGTGATNIEHDTPVAIAIGQYDGDAAGHLDICALAHLVPQQSPTGGTGTGAVDLTPRIFMLVGQGGGDLAGGPPLIPGMEIPNFEYRDAAFASGRLAPGNPTDTIVGIDATDDKRNEVQALAPHLFTATPTTTGSWNLSTPVALPAPYSALRVHSLKLVDLDADGLPDLLVRMVSGNPKSASDVVNPTTAIILWNKGGTLDATNPTAVFPSGAICHGAAAIQADTDAKIEIASSCADGKGGVALTIFHYDGSAWSQTAQPFTENGDEPTPITGDFDGDGLEDLAITAGSGATATVQVYLQCAAGDIACNTRTNVAPSGGK